MHRFDLMDAPRIALGARACADDLYKLVVDNLEDHCIILLDADGSVVGWNRGAERITGYRSEEVVGRNLSFIDLPDGAPPRPLALETARLDGRWERQGWWVRQDGRHFWVDETVAPLSDGGPEPVGYVVIARDLTERRRAEEECDQSKNREQTTSAHLEAAERRAAFLAEASSILVASALNFDGAVRSLARLAASRLADWCVVYSLESDGRINRLDTAHRDPRKEEELKRLIGATLDPRQAHPVATVIRTGHSLRMEEVREEALSALTQDPTRVDDLRRFGLASAMFTPLIARGRALGGILFAHATRAFGDPDLSLADELTRRAAIAIDNARLYRAAQEANRAKADFLAVVSHELRTPLNAIMGYADLLDAGISGPVSDEQHRQLGKVRSSARHLLQLIEEILSYARLESGGVEIDLKQTTIKSIADEAAAVMEPMARSKGIDLNLQLPQDDAEFWTDPPKARQILVNLLSNAVKDTGVGMANNQLDRIFDAFVQAEPPTTRRAGGTGLGLSVARRFARLLGGEIDVRSTPGRGSIFSVRLPLRRGSTHPPGHAD